MAYSPAPARAWPSSHGRNTTKKINKKLLFYFKIETLAYGNSACVEVSAGLPWQVHAITQTLRSAIANTSVAVSIFYTSPYVSRW